MYDYKDIYLYGDGANWIKSAADALGATYITDLFHTMQAVNRLTTDDAWRIELTKAILSNKKFIFEVFKKQELLKNKPSKLRLNSYKYLMNHWNTIQLNFTKSKSIGCSQEGINSHYYASRLTSRPKGFHEASARVIAQLVNIKHNDEDFELEIEDRREEYSEYIDSKILYKAVSKIINLENENARTIKYKIQQVIEEILYLDIKNNNINYD